MALIALLLAGCAANETRFLSKEQDESMRKICEPAGCRVVPLPLWQEIQQIFRQLFQHKDA